MQSRRAIWQSRILDAATVVLLVAAAVLFFDARRNGAQSQVSPAPSALETKSRVPAVKVIEQGGTRAALLTAGQAGQLVLFFRTDCPVCAQQRADWIKLATQARAAGWAVTGVSTEPLTKAVSQYLGDGFRIVQMDAAVAAALRTSVVPTTLAAGADGKVLLHHPGLMSLAVTDSITRFF